MKNDTCVIGIYFGKLRDDFPLWLKSCKYNPKIDFLLFTDAELDSYRLPINVKVYKTSLSEVVDIASERLGFKVRITQPYKLCDFRPAYGIIFQDLIKGYKYWGHCDFDMMFGDIEYFIKRYNISEYIHFLTQGHLSFYKNEKKTNDLLYLDEGRYDVKTIFTSNKNFAFDENYGIGRLYKNHGIPQFEKNIYADISPIYRRLRRSPYYCYDEPPSDYKYQLFAWIKGKIFCIYISEDGDIKKEELMYIHYQKRKFSFEIDKLENADTIVFCSNKIIPWEGEIFPEDIAKLNPRRTTHDFIDFCKWKLKKNFNRFIQKFKSI